MKLVRTAPLRVVDRRQGSGRGGHAARARILVVDDVAENRSVLERWLTRQGHEVAVAEDGRAALGVATRQPFDLVLLDLEMPELDGYEVLRHLKGAGATRDVPVIMISGLNELHSIVRCIEAGAEDYLQKPFEPTLLAARVRVSLDKKRMRDAETEYMGQVARVIEAAQDLDARRYTPGTLGGVAVRSDALGSLARVFDTLAAGVQAREDQLQARIDALQVELAAGLGGRLDDEITAAATAPVSAGFDPHAAGNGHEPALEHALFAGRFEIKSILGRGGMGVVYRARDRDLDEDVAIKVISPNLHWESNGAIERFKSEIRLARRISSPHIMRTHDLGEWNDTYFLTMEYVEGITLHQLIERRGKLLPTAVLGIAMQLTEALEAAHRQGVIHRDIKPANLLLDRTGVLKLMDFGVALMVQASATPTKAGLIIGTPAYMSPEQLLDDPVDARTDLYAAGVVLYECLTGRCPFSAEQLFQLVAKVLEDVPDPPATLDPTIPPALSQLVVRLMARHREDRPANAQELRGLLAALA